MINASNESPEVQIAGAGHLERVGTSASAGL
jgi:hypothetical protein